jgi:putative ABC transport system ATP-binding protein
MLELEHVVKRYASASEEVRALDGISLELSTGEMLALQGPSGSGKTTLLLLAAAVLHADAGSVRFEGADLAQMSERQAAQYRLSEVGLVSQTPQLMAHVSAVENAATKLLLGGMRLAVARERALTWLERVGMAERAERTPEQLSGGERQRVAIARALATEPKLVLADEPTANLDSARSQEIVAVLAGLAHEGGSGVLLVTHDDTVAAAADRALHLRDGRIGDRLVEGARR